MDAQPYQPLSGQHGVERVPYEPFRSASDKARIREAISFTMRTENGISPRPPTIIDSIFGDHKYVRECMLHPRIDEIARAVGGTPPRIQLLIRVSSRCIPPGMWTIAELERAAVAGVPGALL